MGILLGAGREAKPQRLVAQTVAILQHQQPVTGQLRQQHLLPRLPLMFAGHRQHHRLVKQRQFDEGGRLLDQGQDGTIDGATLQLRDYLVGLRLVQIELQFRKVMAQTGN